MMSTRPGYNVSDRRNIREARRGRIPGTIGQAGRALDRGSLGRKAEDLRPGVSGRSSYTGHHCHRTVTACHPTVTLSAARFV